MAKYRKKPVVVEAIQYDGRNSADIHEFCGDKVREPLGKDYLEIETLEGIHKCIAGDYVIKGIKGEFYPCKPDIFEQTYEKVDPENLNHRSKESIQFIAETAGVDEEIAIKVLLAEDEYVSYILKVLSGEKEAL